MNIRPFLFIAMGVSLLVVGLNMKDAQMTWDETLATPISIPATKGRNSAIGAGVGAIGGGALAAIVGGVGVVIAGTGIGLPAGAALIATSAAIGAGAGAVAGAATGRSETTVVEFSTISHSAHAYEIWHWAIVMTVGFVLLILAALETKAQHQTLLNTDMADRHLPPY